MSAFISRGKRNLTRQWSDRAARTTKPSRSRNGVGGFIDMLFTVFHGIQNDFGALLNAQNTGIQANVVIL